VGSNPSPSQENKDSRSTSLYLCLCVRVWRSSGWRCRWEVLSRWWNTLPRWVTDRGLWTRKNALKQASPTGSSEWGMPSFFIGFL